VTLPKLAALSFDRALLGPTLWGDGRVEGVWPHSLTVRLGRGELVVLLHPERDLCPLGARVPWEARPQRGEPARLVERGLLVGRLEISLEGEGVSLEVRPRLVSARALGEQLAALDLPPRTRALVDNPRGDPVLELCHFALECLATEIGGVATPLEFEPTVRRLVGLGPGATPTGDDVLVGLAAAAHRLAGAGVLPRSRLSDFAGALSSVPADATTPVAHAMLGHAARGCFVEPLTRFAEALGDEAIPPHGARALAALLAAVGSTTGSDLLAGAVMLVRLAAR
jgi:hypothetical protein